MQTKTKQKIIAHLDMDAFFAAIEERNNPRWHGLPIVVGADPEQGQGRGVVSTANYTARQYGIHSAQPIQTAWRLAEAARRQGRPAAIFTSGSWRTYSQVSQNIIRLLKKYSPRLEQRSVDEAYFDLSPAGSYERAARVSQKIKQAIKQEEKLTASIGIGPNKLIAKIASDYQKPDGLTIVSPADIQTFLDSQPVRVLPGVGPKTEALLHQCKIYTIHNLRNYSQTSLLKIFGRWGEALHTKARGLGSTELHEHPEPPQSISEQTTFRHDTLAPIVLIPCVHELCQHVHHHLRQKNFTSFRTLTLTVRFANFTTKNRSRTFPAPVRSLTTVTQEAMKLLLPFLDARANPHHQAIRLLGVGVSKLA